ncbi:hypothetical protein GCM10008014_30240 [Paenibacillus silvae]|uniref:Glycosyl transferase n=1 Tax=Paenibacillus silvae TaxID=1325358 RepID=A0ABQ1ZCD4_9BACL|nr:hypothetical protein GCM10008014_30240 [Paenibacillus silvae]
MTKVDRLPGNKQNFEEAVRILKPVVANKKQLFWDENFLNYVISTGFYCFHINTLVMDKEVFEAIGLFNERLTASEDTDYSFRIFERYRICLLWEYNYIYHRDVGSNNLYNFYDRSHLQLDELVQNKELVQRFHTTTLNNINRYKTLKRLIRNSGKLNNKEELYGWIRHTLMIYYYTLSFLNSTHHKSRSLFYAIKYYMISKDISVFQMLLHLGPGRAKIRHEYIDIY